MPGRVGEHRRVAVEAGDLAVRPDPGRQEGQDPDRSAPDVDDVTADGDVEAVEQRPGLAVQQGGLGHQPSPFLLGIAEHVLRSRGRGRHATLMARPAAGVLENAGRSPGIASPVGVGGRRC